MRLDNTFLVIGLSGINVGEVTPTLLGLPDTKVITLTGNDQAQNLEKMTVKRSSDFESSIPAYGTKYTCHMKSEDELDAFLQENNAWTVVIKTDHKHLNQLLRGTKVVFTCARTHTRERAELLAQISFEGKVIPVVVLDNDYNVCSEMKECLEELAPGRFEVSKGVVHCVVPDTEYKGDENEELVAEAYTSDPYLVIPPLPDGTLNIPIEVFVGLYPRIVMAKSDQELRFHVEQKAGLNSLMQLMSAQAQMDLAVDGLNVEDLRKKPFSEYYAKKGVEYASGFAEKYAREFYVEHLAKYDDEFSTQEGFVLMCRQLVEDDLIRDSIGRSLKNGKAFEKYEKYYKELSEGTKALIVAYKNVFGVE